MFLHPALLGLLLLPLLLAVYQLRLSSVGADRPPWLAAGLRLLALSLVVAALARPFQRLPETAKRIVAVVDCSPSVGETVREEAATQLKMLAAKAGPGRFRLVVFGPSAREVALDEGLLTSGGLKALEFSEPGSAIAEALELAAALCPADATGEIHLFSDGRETRGDLVSAAAELGRRGLGLKLHELGLPAASPVLLRQVRAPAAGAVGEAVTFTATVECQHAGEAKLTMTDDTGKPVAGLKLHLREGLQEVPFQMRPEEAGWQHYRVSLDCGDQTVSTGLMVSRTVVGLLETAPEAPALQALRDLLGDAAEIRPLTPSDLTEKGLETLDVIALADMPAAELPVERQQALRTWVESGGGLLVTGGRNTFGPGGYARSELAEVLPLRFPQKKEVRDPGTSLAIIIDTSGSMGTEGVNLAREVARLALKRLKPHDKAGIVEFHGAKRWAAPMQSAANNIALQRSLNRLACGGGTVVLPAIEEAYYGLLNVRSRTKHVLLLTDGGVEQGAFEPLLRRMAGDSIHVSTVLIGPRAGSSFLSTLASWGGGQFYTAPSRFKIPEVIVKQPSSSLLETFVEQEMGLEPVLASQLLQAVDMKGAPKLRGYVKTEAKETAELLLRSEIGDPVLARWHYGLGRVALLTTQFGGTWAEAFLKWPAAPNLTANLTRQLGGRSPRQPLALHLAWSSAGLALDIRSLSADPLLAAAPLRVEVKHANPALNVTRDLLPVRAHTWRTRFEDLPAGDFLIEVKRTADEKILASGGLSVPPPNEFSRAAPDRERLGAARAAHDVAAREAEPKTSVLTREYWPLCAALGLLCFILMILVRRLPGGSAPALRRGQSAATALALLLVTLLSAQPVNAAREARPLDIFGKLRVNRILAMKPSEAWLEMKEECRRVMFRSGDLTTTCGYLRSFNEPKAAPLLALALAANGDLKEAEEILAALAQAPDAEPWISLELAQVKSRLLERLNRREVSLAVPFTPEEKAHLNRIVGLKPAEARQALKLFCEEQNRRQGDLTPLCDHLRTLTDLPAAKPLLALAALANGELREADTILSACVEEPAADGWVLSELAQIKEMLGDTGQALSLLERALKRAPEPGLRFALRVRQAQLLYEAHELEAARTALRSIANDPTSTGQESRNYCARLASLHGDDTLVAELFKPTGQGNTLRRNLLFLGEALMRLNKPAEALKPFEEALALSTLERDRRYVLDRLVGAARKMEALPALMDAWLKAEEMFPEQLDILVGILGGELDRTTEVLALLERRDLSAKTRKLLETPAFQERLALLASETGKTAFARQAYRKLIERQPDDITYRNGYVRLLLLDNDRAAAEAVYREAIATAKQAKELMEVAASARGVGLKEIALQAVAQASGLGDAALVQTQLFMADVYREQGDSDKTLDVLREMERASKGGMEVTLQLGHAYERNGFVNDAIRLFQKADPFANERVLVKLITLMEAQNRNDEAFALWRRLWETATEPMLVIQANDRLLEIGSKTGKLADLALELEERLDQGTLREREQALLLDIYTSVSDPVSAADILMELSRQQGGGTLESYKRLLRVYMECELFGRCNAVLHKLIALDPDNRDDYLQTLVLIALERRNDGDALRVLEQMAERSKDGILRDSFSASVLKMIGKPEEAAFVYRRALAENPDEVETWLLWGNALLASDAKELEDLKRQGKRPPSPDEMAGNRKVCGFFSVLLGQTEADDLFTIALDGLLNAGAPPYALKNALRRLNERIAAEPFNFLLYRLSADLHEELKQMNEVDKILRLGLFVADDESSVIVRELIAMASAEKRTKDMISYGRSLLNIATHLPPAECLDLGTLLLNKGHANEAEVAFQRVMADSRAPGAARGVVEQYEKVGLFNKAGKVLRSLLGANAFDVELLLRLGLVEEKKGDFVASGSAYEQAIGLLLGRLPRLTKLADEKGGTRELNIDEVDLFLAPALRGLIVSTRTPERSRRLLDDMWRRVREELDNLKASNTFGATADENPRLNLLAKIMRRLCFVFHERSYGEDLDDTLLRQYPGDPKLRSGIVAQRCRWRTFQSADELLVRNRLDDGRFRVAKAFLDGREAVAKRVTGKGLSAAEQVETLKLLALHGYDELVDQVTAGCDLNGISMEEGETLLAVGLAANQPGLVREALFTNLNRFRQVFEATGKGTRERNRLYARPMALYKQIVAAWPVLSEQDRNSAANLYAMLLEEDEALELKSCAYHFLLSQTGRAPEISLAVMEEYMSRGWLLIPQQRAVVIDAWLGQQPAGQRPEAVRRLLGTKQGSERTDLLKKLSRCLTEATLTDELRQTFPELVADREANGAETFSVAEAGRGMAEKRVEIQKTIAIMRSTMGSDARLLFTLHERTLRQAASLLPPRELDFLLQELKDSADPFKKLIAFMLLLHAGRDVEALAQLQTLAALTGEDAVSEAARAALPPLLTAYGWLPQATRFLPEGFAASGAGLEMYVALHDPLALLESKNENRLGASRLRIHAAKLMASPAQLLQATRIYYADTRHPDVVNNFRLWYESSTWPSRMNRKPGGLAGLGAEAPGSILEDIAEQPGGQEELIDWLRALDDRLAEDAPLCMAIAGSVSTYGLSPRLQQTWQSAPGQTLLNRMDRDLLAALAVRAPEHLPKELAGQMKSLLLNNRKWDAETTLALAKACKVFGHVELARSLGRWSVTKELLATGSAKGLPDYLATFPEAERKRVLTGLLPYMGPSNIRLATGDGLGPMLSALLDQGMTSEAGKIIDSYLRYRPLLPSAYVREHSQAKELVEGIDTDPNILDDAVLVALARLNRPEDYVRLLEQKVRGSFPVLHPQIRYLSLSPTAPVDATGTLPEPGDVADINPYIDSHLKMLQRFRQSGDLSPVNQVAQLCMLGGWCAQRGLKERATTLLKQAEELSAGMLSGRLWVADLQRLLGHAAAAEQSEQALLACDLLPMPRVPAALDVLAASKGRAQADAAAFRVAGYSNHPLVLPQALRHARTQGLTKEADELAERLRKVSTLFLPQGL